MYVRTHVRTYVRTHARTYVCTYVCGSRCHLALCSKLCDLSLFGRFMPHKAASDEGLKPQGSTEPACINGTSDVMQI